MFLVKYNFHAINFTYNLVPEKNENHLLRCSSVSFFFLPNIERIREPNNDSFALVSRNLGAKPYVIFSLSISPDTKIFTSVFPFFFSVSPLFFFHIYNYPF